MMLMIKTQNCHNLANFAATTCRFCMVVDINDTYGLYFYAKFYVYFANKLMRTHLAYLSYISAFQAGFCWLARFCMVTDLNDTYKMMMMMMTMMMMMMMKI